VWERNEHDPLDSCFETGIDEIRKPQGVGFRKEFLGPGCKKDSSEVHHDIRSGHRWRERGWVCEVGANRSDMGRS
jgi:hypothetical protein